ncbi:MAG: FAD-dependent oxidoreductase [Pseudomonadota bacterium]
MESLAQDLSQMQRTPLADEHVDMIRAAGVEQTFPGGSLVVTAGHPMDAFIYCEEGQIEVVDPLTNERAIEATVGPTQYLGEVSFLNGGTWAISMRAVVDTRCVVVPRTRMLELMANVPEMSDIIVTVFAARRRRIVEDNNSALTIIGAEEDRNLGRVLSFASRNKIPIRTFDLGTDEANEFLRQAGLPENEPAFILGRDEVIENPSPRRLARMAGLDLPLAGEDAFDVVIIGGGPAGIAAAVYAGAEGLSALVVEDQVIGGQAGSSSRIENYMGFPTGISGADLCFRGEIQAMRLGARFVMPRRVVSIRQHNDRYCIGLDDGEDIAAKAIVVATGVQYRRLPIDRLTDFEGQGVYYSATDIEARYCRKSEAVIIGGGNSAGQAAMFLSRSASHVHVLVRGKALADSMSAYLSSRLEQDPKITVHFQTECISLEGEDKLQTIRVRDKETGEEREITTPALFVMVGAAPKTDWLEGTVALDEKGFILTGGADHCPSAYATSAPGIYAVGDVRAGSTKRVASGVGEGSVVIAHVWNYVNR